MNTEQRDELERLLGKATLKHIEIKQCCCGYQSCQYYWLTGIGKFVQGSGFTEDEAALIANTINNLPALISDSRRLEQAEREKEELSAMLDVERGRPEDLANFLEERAEASEARSQSLQEEVERLRGALRPFKQMADHHDETDRHYKINRSDKQTVNVELGTLRRARAALTATDPKTGGEG